MMKCVTVGLLALLTAWFTGSQFAQTGSTGYSMAMGVMTAVAMLCYLANLGSLGRYLHE